MGHSTKSAALIGIGVLLARIGLISFSRFFGLALFAAPALFAFDELSVSSRGCAYDLSLLPANFLTTPVGTWAQSTVGTSTVTLVGPSYIPAAVQKTGEANEVIYFHLLPGRAKGLRNRLSPQEVNDIFSEFLLRLSFELSRTGVIVNHHGIFSEYKSMRIQISREDIRLDAIEDALQSALEGFEASLSIRRPEVYKLLKGSVFSRASWIQYGIGANEYEAALAARYSEKDSRHFDNLTEKIESKIVRMAELVSSIPDDLEKISRLHLVSISQSKGRVKKALAIELFEILRAAETPEVLADLISHKFQPPGKMSDEEIAELWPVVQKLFELRGLLKEFTPPNRWDLEDLSPFDHQKQLVTKIENADRLLSLDLKGVGARLFSEIFERLQAGVENNLSSSDLLKTIRIDRTAEWLKKTVNASLKEAKDVLGDRYQTHVWVGDELNIYYTGESVAHALRTSLNPSVRLMDLQIRQNAKSLSVSTQSLIAQVAEVVSKKVEKELLATLEPIPSLSIVIDLTLGAPQVQFHFYGMSEDNLAAADLYVRTALRSRVQSEDPRVNALFDKFTFAPYFHDSVKSSSSAQAL